MDEDEGGFGFSAAAAPSVFHPASCVSWLAAHAGSRVACFRPDSR